MGQLQIQDFDAFFREIHGVDPFEWQRQLARRVAASAPCNECVAQGLNFEQCTHAGWPPMIALPTASGKTAVIDIAIFALALDPSPTRRAPLRIFFVVDRRIVVDEAYRRAARIASTLASATNGMARMVADRLRAIAGNGADPLLTTVLRGGIYREDNWARSPIQPLVVVSTVDQVGSRLLGRGYGVSDAMKPVHQGLIGHDSLIILDEAHLSEPFRETLEALRDYAAHAAVRLPRPFQVVVMSATPRSPGALSLGRNHPDCQGRLRPRLEAQKRAELRLVDVGKPPSKSAPYGEHEQWRQGRKERDTRFCAEAARAACELIGTEGVHCLGVVVNRVGTARQVFETIRRDNSFDVVLLTGRSRPLDRDAVVASIWERARAGRERQADTRPLVVVATQCIEVGADLDFDALVTECASLDALKQRFGRLDRLGTLGTSRAIILARTDTLDDDPVYGEALGKTWKWLQHHATKPPRRRNRPPEAQYIDCGPAHFPTPLEAEIEALLAPRRETPVLLPAHLDAWATTSPRPAVDPDVAPWLHGVSDDIVDVQIVWRADLPEDKSELWSDIVALCPPGSAEALPVPIYVARAWLASKPEAPVADVAMSVEEEASPGPEHGTPSRQALRWCGEDSDGTRLVAAHAVRPGDTLVVPASWGGADEFGWLPDKTGTQPVSDLGDRVQLEQRGRATLRICSTLSQSWVPRDSSAYAPLRRMVQELSARVEEEGEDNPDVDALLNRLCNADGAAEWLREAARRLHNDPRRRVDLHPTGGIVLRSSQRSPYAPTGIPSPAEPPEADFTTQDDASSFVARPVGLMRHLYGVGTLAGTFAATCGLSLEMQNDLALAGQLHDVGKADPRFQRWLHGGDEVAAVLSALLAKSGMRSRRLRERARQLSGYPQGARHELLSLAMIEQEVHHLGAHDKELVRHLVASHHGFCRPFAAVFDDPHDIQVEVDASVAGRRLRASTSAASRLSQLGAGVAERYWRLLRKYGWLGLPYLEAVLRLADHRQSELEEQEENAP